MYVGRKRKSESERAKKRERKRFAKAVVLYKRKRKTRSAVHRQAGDSHNDIAVSKTPVYLLHAAPVRTTCSTRRLSVRRIAPWHQGTKAPRHRRAAPRATAARGRATTAPQAHSRRARAAGPRRTAVCGAAPAAAGSGAAASSSGAMAGCAVGSPRPQPLTRAVCARCPLAHSPTSCRRSCRRLLVLPAR